MNLKKILILLFSVIALIIFALILPSQFGSTEIWTYTAHDNNNSPQVAYVKGDTPIIITASHGGWKKPQGPDGNVLKLRDNDNALTVPDLKTNIIVKELVEKLNDEHGLKVSSVRALFSRKYIDANRNDNSRTGPESATPSNNDAYEDSNAKKFYDAFHNKIDDLRADILNDWKQTMLFDVHGHGRKRCAWPAKTTSKDRSTIKARSGNNDINNITNGDDWIVKKSATLIMRGTRDSKSLKHLMEHAEAHGSNNGFDVLTSTNGFFGAMEDIDSETNQNAYNSDPNYQIVPSNIHPSIAGTYTPEKDGFNMFSGGFITTKYGSIKKRSGNVIQIELSSLLRYDALDHNGDGKKRKDTSVYPIRDALIADMATAIKRMYDNYLTTLER